MRNRTRKFRADKLAAELFDDDGVDPRTAFSRLSHYDNDAPGRKALQAARVIRHALESALRRCDDSTLSELEVLAVEPVRGASSFRVLLRAQGEPAAFVDGAAIQARLARLRGFLRAGAAADLRRRKAPELRFLLVPVDGGAHG